MSYRTYRCPGVGFYTEKRGHIVIAVRTADEVLASDGETFYSINAQQFLSRLEAEGLEDMEDGDVYIEDPDGTLAPGDTLSDA